MTVNIEKYPDQPTIITSPASAGTPSWYLFSWKTGEEPVLLMKFSSRRLAIRAALESEDAETLFVVGVSASLSATRVLESAK